MPGTVTVFNCYNEPITSLSVSGNGVGDVAAASDGSSGKPPKYTPSGKAIPRSKHSEQGKFAIGDNPVQIPWNSFTGTTTIQIPNPTTAPVSLDDDLVLYVTTNKAILVLSRGYVFNTFDVKTVVSVEGEEEQEPPSA
jgi:hypothetical protein